MTAWQALLLGVLSTLAGLALIGWISKHNDPDAAAIMDAGRHARREEALVRKHEAIDQQIQRDITDAADQIRAKRSLASNLNAEDRATIQRAAGLLPLQNTAEQMRDPYIRPYYPLQPDPTLPRTRNEQARIREWLEHARPGYGSGGNCWLVIGNNKDGEVVWAAGTDEAAAWEIYRTCAGTEAMATVVPPDSTLWEVIGRPKR